MNQLRSLTFSGIEVRTLILAGEPWWVANDVCSILGIKNQRDAITRIHADDVGTTDIIDTLGRPQKTNIVSESGLYDLVFQSRKPEALAFRRWVTKEVLPSIRKNGFYAAEKSVEMRFIEICRQLQDLNFLPHTSLKIAAKILKITDDDQEIGDMIHLADTLKKQGSGHDLIAKICREIPKRFAIKQLEKQQRRLSG